MGKDHADFFYEKKVVKTTGHKKIYLDVHQQRLRKFTRLVKAFVNYTRLLIFFFCYSALPMGHSDTGLYTRSEVLRLSWPHLFSNDYQYRTQTQFQSRQDFSQWVISEQSERREGSGVKAISWGSSLFYSSASYSFAQGFFTWARKLIYRHHQYLHMRNEKCCNEFLLWKIVEL